LHHATSGNHKNLSEIISFLPNELRNTGKVHFSIPPNGKAFIGYVKLRELNETKEKGDKDKSILETDNLKVQLQLNLDTIRNKQDRILSIIAICISAIALIISYWD
jgi:hypothetical protein